MNTASWIIIDISTKEAILETYSKNIADAVNTKKYRAVPVLEYLQQLNKSLKN